MKRQPKTWGKRIVIQAGAWLRDGKEWNSPPVQRVHRRLEVIGEWGTFGYIVPMGGRVLYTGDGHVEFIDDFPRRKRFTRDEADEHNTQLVTCRHCGEWLKDGDDGYGTEYGHCGCEDSAE